MHNKLDLNIAQLKSRHLEYIFINLKTIKLVRSAFSWEEGSKTNIKKIRTLFPSLFRLSETVEKGGFLAFPIYYCKLVR